MQVPDEPELERPPGRALFFAGNGKLLSVDLPE
jgi:hypothetical protein